MFVNQMPECGKHCKRSSGTRDVFSKLLNHLVVNMPEERTCTRQILHSLRYQTHQPATGGVHRHRVVTENQEFACLWCPLNTAISFHPHNAVHDYEIRPDR